MRIGIEAQRIFRKKKHGMDMVALELIRNLQKIDTENEYVIFVSPDEENSLLGETANFRIAELRGAYPVWEQILLPAAAEKEGCDLLHCTSNTAPVFSKVPVMVTLHDIIYMEKSYAEILLGPGTWYQKIGNCYRRLVVPRILKKCRKIITVSEFERKRIAGFFGMPDDQRLTAVYNGVGPHFRPVTDRSEISRVKEKYKLPDRFFFFLGNTDPKKNTRGTLQAYASFLKKSQEDIKLVMLDYDRAELDRLLKDIGAPEVIDRIVLTGYVVNTDLPAIYSQCEIFLYPSIRESFGLPVLEAMACGVPVITSNTSSMPEVAGDSAYIADPFNPETITDGMIALLRDKNLRAAITGKGYDRAAKFSWTSMARQVMNIYKETAEPAVKK
jgi:glycosyltransferase involved in cell wall biosynthesis